MRVLAKQKSNILILDFEPDEDDRLAPTKKYNMAKKRCEFHLPNGFSIEELHADHLGLVCIMLCMPFVGSNLHLPKPISEKFHQSTKVISRFKVGPVDELTEPYIATLDSRPGLAFSGGVDSVAALEIMPENTVCVFLDRPIKKGSLYDKEAPLDICNKFISLGREVHMISSDLEYLRSPIGFPVDVANSAPAVLLSELLSFNSIAFGTILESAYGLGHKKYRDYRNGNHYRTWGTMFRGAGIPLNLAVAGLSEVATSKVIINAGLSEFSQSCIRGKIGEPCRNCWKCFRKILLDTVLRKNEITDDVIDEMFKIKEAIHHLKGFPIKHENVLTYITSKYQGKHFLMNLLKKRVRGDILDLSWLENWNSDSMEILHSSTKQDVVQSILEQVQEMDENMMESMRNWDMTEMLENPKYAKLRDELIENLS